MDNQPNQNNAFAHLFKNAPQPRPTPPQEASLNPPTEQEQKKPNSAETGGLEATAKTVLSASKEPMVKDVPNMPLEQDRPAMPRLRPSDFGIERKKPKKKATAKKTKKPAPKKAKKPLKKKKAAAKKKLKPKPKKKILKKAAKKAPKKSAVKKGKKQAKKKSVKKAKKAAAKKKTSKGKKRR